MKNYEANYWAERAGKYNKTSWVKNVSFIDSFLGMLPDKPFNSILEVGIGTGAIAEKVAENVGPLIGIDISKEMISNINHPNIKGTLDFSHAYLNCNHRKVDFMNEIKAMSPISNHLHVHDSYGILNNLWTYNDSEMLSYGIGDLHLPIGWGTIPFDDIFDKLNFPAGLILNLEIQERFIDYFIEKTLQIRINYKVKISNDMIPGVEPPQFFIG